jgi:hypothetical protein
MSLLKVSVLRFDHLCYGQWYSMVHLSPRVPLKKQRTDNVEVVLPEQIEATEVRNDDKEVLIATEKPDFEIDIDKDYVLV